VWLKLPAGAATATTSSTVHYRDAADGQTKTYGDPVTATVEIAEDEASARSAALAALDAVVVPAADQAKLQGIKADVGATAAETSDPKAHWARLQALLVDIGTLERSRWTNAEPARIALARLVAYVQYDYDRAGGQ
jgi:hypothetical protein